MRTSLFNLPTANSLQPTPGSAISSAFAVDIAGPAWLSSLTTSHHTMNPGYLVIAAVVIVFVFETSSARVAGAQGWLQT
jgi:hypothetical protein